MDIWPNLVTEILGAWISVRIIDYFIRIRERKSSARWRVVRIILYILGVCRRIHPKPYAYDLKILQDELRFFDEPHNLKQLNTHLSPDEISDVNEVRALSGRILDLATQVSVIIEQLSKFAVNIRDQIDEYNETDSTSFYLHKHKSIDRLLDLHRDVIYGAVVDKNTVSTAIDSATRFAFESKGFQNIAENIIDYSNELVKFHVLIEKFSQHIELLEPAVHRARTNIIEEEI